MPVTLSNIMEGAWRKLGHIVEDVTLTGGSTTTLIDTVAFAQKFTSDDALIGGTAIITRDAGGASAAPEGEFKRITDYAASTSTFTVGSAFSAAAAAGDEVAIVKPTISLEQMRKAVNDGLTNLGTISLVDTSIVTASNQTEYALPVGLKIKRLLDVQLQGSTADGNDNKYASIIGQTTYVPATAGSTGLLIIPQFAADYTIKIIYEGVHPVLHAHSDKVSETIQEELAIAAARKEAVQALLSRRGGSADEMLKQDYNSAASELERQKAEKPIYRIKPRAKFFVGGTS